MKQKEQVLLYQFPPEILPIAEKALHKLGVATRVLPDGSHEERIGYLLGLGGFKPTGSQAEPFSFPHEVMVLHNIKQKRLDQVLRALKDSGVPPITYKAVVTPFNVLWTLKRLCETMRKEHDFMIARQN